MNQKPFKILGIEHVGIAMQNMEGISAFFSDILGLEYLGSEKIDDEQVVTDIFNTGDKVTAKILNIDVEDHFDENFDEQHPYIFF